MKCPGQDTRYWKEDAIFEVKCPFCGTEIEFFKDEATRKCPNCKKVVPNPKMDFGCAAYCKYAEQCLGSLPPELLAQRKELLKERIGIAVKKVLKDDFGRLEKVVSLAQKVEALAKQKGLSPAVPIMAALLSALSEAERKKVFETANIPQGLTEEIVGLLKKLPETPKPEDFLTEV